MYTLYRHSGDSEPSAEPQRLDSEGGEDGKGGEGGETLLLLRAVASGEKGGVVALGMAEARPAWGAESADSSDPRFVV